MDITPEFRFHEHTLVATMKNKCTFFAVDNLNRPYANFPVRIYNRSQPNLQPLFLRTKPDGKCRALLKKGDFVAIHGIEEDADSAVAPLEQYFEVEQADIPQFFRLDLHRVKIEVNIMLETRFKEPVSRCPFSIQKPGEGTTAVLHGKTSDIGLVHAELVPGSYWLVLEPGTDSSPYINHKMELEVQSNGSFTPTKVQVPTKVTDVSILLVTPDGEPAPRCPFSIGPALPPNSSSKSSSPAYSEYSEEEEIFTTDDAGVGTVRMTLLEPYTFRIKESETGAQEYVAQHFTFQSDRSSVTAVISRTVFGTVREGRVAIVVDCSGSMSIYLEEVRTALKAVLGRQLQGSDKLFNLVAYGHHAVAWRPTLANARDPANIADALNFVSSSIVGFSGGGGPDVFKAP